MVKGLNLDSSYVSRVAGEKRRSRKHALLAEFGRIHRLNQHKINNAPLRLGCRQPTANLPAIASTTSTTAATTAAAPTAWPSPIPAPSARALRLGTGLIYIKRASPDLAAVERGNRFLAILRVRHLDKAKAARTSGVAIGHDANPVHLSVGFEEVTQFLFCSIEIEIAYKNVLHAIASV